MAKDHSNSEIEETRCCHYMGYSFQLAVGPRGLLYAPSHKHDTMGYSFHWQYWILKLLLAYYFIFNIGLLITNKIG